MSPPRRLRGRSRVLAAAAALALLAALAAGAVLAARGRGAERWSTESETARAELEAGTGAVEKLYTNDAVRHFEAALAADPDFLVAKVLLVRYGHLLGDRGRVERLIEDLRRADLAAVSPRERLLVRYLLARVDRRPDDARELLAGFLGEHPDDPWAVDLECGDAWGAGDWTAAKACYRRLIELDPNRVEAQNRIGYVEMAEGDFGEAEAQFQIYRFLAPEQANPHDSMGELMLLTGRYDEAEAELRRALELRPDFCASRLNLVLLHLLRHDFAGAEATVAAAAAAGGCPPHVLARQPCSIALWRHLHAGRFSAAWDAARGCGELPVDLDMAYFAAAAAGRLDETVALVEALRREAAGQDSEYGEGHPWLHHLEAVDAWFAGDPAAAAKHGLMADAGLLYWTGQWLFKLQNRRLTAAALEAAGRPDDAAALHGEVRAVHPQLLDDPPYPLPAPAAAAGVP